MPDQYGQPPADNGGPGSAGNPQNPPRGDAGAADAGPPDPQAELEKLKDQIYGTGFRKGAEKARADLARELGFASVDDMLRRRSGQSPSQQGQSPPEQTDYRSAFQGLREKTTGLEREVETLRKLNERLTRQSQAAKEARITAELLGLGADPQYVGLLLAHVGADIDWNDDSTELEVFETVDGVRRPARHGLKDHLTVATKTFPALFKARPKSGAGNNTRQDQTPRQDKPQKKLSTAEKAAEWMKNRGY